MPRGSLYTSLSSWEWVCLENMSSVDARRLFSCQKILFTFHFYTAPQPHSGAFSSLLHFQKTCTACTYAFPLSISLSDSKPTGEFKSRLQQIYTVVSTSTTLSCFRKEMAFCWCLAESTPHETHCWCLTEEILLDYMTSVLNFLPNLASTGGQTKLRIMPRSLAS